MDVVELREREHEEPVLRLLTQAQIHVDADLAARRAPEIVAEYRHDPGLRLWGACREDGAVVGILGMEDRGDGAGLIRDLAVLPEARGTGVGRALVEHAKSRYHTVAGDTVEEAAGFYERCGFVLVPAGSLPGGRTVLRFSWSAP